MVLERRFLEVIFTTDDKSYSLTNSHNSFFLNSPGYTKSVKNKTKILKAWKEYKITLVIRTKRTSTPFQITFTW